MSDIHEVLGSIPSAGTILVFVTKYPPDKPGVFWGFTKEDYDKAIKVQRSKDGVIH